MNVGKYGEKINPYTLPGRVDGGHCFRLVALGNKEDEQQQQPAVTDDLILVRVHHSVSSRPIRQPTETVAR
jgi:hypothetical protein